MAAFVGWFDLEQTFGQVDRRRLKTALFGDCAQPVQERQLKVLEMGALDEAPLVGAAVQQWSAVQIARRGQPGEAVLRQCFSGEDLRCTRCSASSSTSSQTGRSGLIRTVSASESTKRGTS